MIKNEKSKSNFFNRNSNALSQQYLSTIATDTTGNKKEIIEKKSIKEFNIINFIKQKNKFYISNFFDEKEAKKFLESKEIALKRIVLNDEIENTNNNIDITNNYLQIQKTEIKNEKSLKQQNQKENSSSPIKKKNKIDKNKISNENKNDDKSSDSEINFNIIETVNNCENSKDNSFIYKFIIDNADESEDNFRKKLKKEIKRVATKKNNINNKNIDNSGKTQASNKKNDKNNIKADISEKSGARVNPFKYSEINRNLMIGNDIEVSSINDDDSKSPERIQTKNLTTLEDKKDDTNKNFYIKSNSNNQMGINSAHESLMSILSGLI